ncbi:MAG: sarcosine oxidase subunit alpha family protein [Parvularculaceae bacterium]
MSGYRLSSGGVIDRARPLSFSFEGKRYSGFAGDTLASALLANGVDVIGRSFKYHRPRGLLAAGLEEPNAIMQIGEGAQTIPDLKATAVELYDDLVAAPVNAWPSLAVDAMAVNALFKRFIPAGFYYKTFTWPHWSWFEPSIRKAAGLGEAPTLPDTDEYDKRYAECDVLVVGGGPAGVMAALAASRSGARVMVVETDARWGGFVLDRDVKIGGYDGRDWASRAVAELEEAPETTLLNRTTAFGYYDHNFIGLIERRTDHLPSNERKGPRQRLWKVRAKEVILATGAIERPLVFPNNDRPGVMLASAGETYAHRYGAAPGRRVLIATNNNSAYECALSLQSAGVDIVAITDGRAHPAGPAVERALGAGLALLPGMTVTDVRGASGLRGAELHALDERGGAIAGKRMFIDCDCVLVSGGWSPAVHLFSQSGGKLRFDAELQAFVPEVSVQKERSVGAAAGVFSLQQALAGAAAAGVAAARGAGFTPPSADVPEADDAPLGAVRALWRTNVKPLGRPGAKAWLDFQNDVTTSDVKLAIDESFRSVEHVKRYTTLGMASDQGKTSNVNAIGVMEEYLAKPMGEVGTTKFRPPYEPVTMGAFAGRRVRGNLAPRRKLPAHLSHQKLGAVFEDYGSWSRPAFYARAGESETEAVRREAAHVRSAVGLFDGSPLGKIEVAGPDAAEFLDRIYANAMKSLKPGRCRYGLMLSETGTIIDDGVLACLGEGRYLVGTTSGHASMVAEMLQEWLQCEWVDFDVVTQDVTTSWAVMTVTGPRACEVLAKLETDIDFSKQAFAHMDCREGMLEGVPARVQRVSYTGELSFEISVPWGYGAALWELLLDLGKDEGVAPFGVEALMVLRTEKGFLHVGADTDGMTLPQDVGFDRLIATRKADFVGKRSLMRPEGLRKDRRQFVGLEAIDGDAPLPIGAHLLPNGAEPPCASEGWVTSSVWSPSLKKPVALGLVARGRERMGEEATVWSLGEKRRVRIVGPCSYDPKGERLDV